ncbi:MAG TPA: hypothetical protein ENF51_01420 [Candidatus Aenigmarchaeota archaeon]|nr:hypothetical protein [Candidatus Aenigmarchaeota archaeon]
MDLEHILSEIGEAKGVVNELGLGVSVSEEDFVLSYSPCFEFCSLTGIIQIPMGACGRIFPQIAHELTHRFYYAGVRDFERWRRKVKEAEIQVRKVLTLKGEEIPSPLDIASYLAQQEDIEEPFLVHGVDLTEGPAHLVELWAQGRLERLDGDLEMILFERILKSSPRPVSDPQFAFLLASHVSNRYLSLVNEGLSPKEAVSEVITKFDFEGIRKLSEELYVRTF